MLRTGQLHRAPPRPRNLARRRRPRYRGPWRLPGPDSHRLAAVSLSLGYVVVLLLSVVLGARATGRTFRRNQAPCRFLLCDPPTSMSRPGHRHRLGASESHQQQLVHVHTSHHASVIPITAIISTKQSHWTQWTVPPSVERRDLVPSLESAGGDRPARVADHHPWFARLKELPPREWPPRPARRRLTPPNSGTGRGVVVSAGRALGGRPGGAGEELQAQGVAAGQEDGHAVGPGP